MQAQYVRKQLSDVLVEKDIVDAQTMKQAVDLLDKDDRSKSKLPQLLVDQFKASRDAVFKAVAEYYAIRIINIVMESVDEEILGFIRKEINALPEQIRKSAAEHFVLPYTIDHKKNGRLLVITPDPTNQEVYKIARSFPYKNFEICYVSLTKWTEIWNRVSIDRSYSDKAATMTQETGAFEEDSALYEQELEEEISRSGLVDLVENIFVDAVRVGASDIHVIPKGEKTTEFHFRVDGKLTRWYTNNDTRAEAVAAVVKDRAKNIDRFERNTAQDGFAQLMIDKKTARFRLSVIPIIGKELRNKFESIVIRILKEPTSADRLEDLGFDPYSEQALRKAIKKPYGIIIVTGPTGSGKSTTLFTALRTIINPSINVLTVEDPVEYYIDGARQVKLNPKLDFDDALRAILRHDPDVVMVGEIRDRLTADIAVKLANTGHLTLSTLHTNDAPSALSRLYKIGVEPFLLATSLNLILAQRLIRKLCPRCKAPIRDSDKEVLRNLGLTDDEINNSKIHRPIGCIECIKGYKGRFAIHEALYITKDIRNVILSSTLTVNEEALRHLAIRNGMITLRKAALEQLKKGMTSVDEVTLTTLEEE